jgi:hypothetical protein
MRRYDGHNQAKCVCQLHKYVRQGEPPVLSGA